MQAAAAVKKHRRLALFVAFWVTLAAQATFAIAVVEPYPALIMPSFAGGANREGDYPTTQLDITIHYDEGPVSQPHVAELMDGFRFSSALPSVKYMFHPDGGGAKAGLLTDEELRYWLEERGRALGDGRDPSTVDFCWHRETIDVTDASVTDAGECESTTVTL